MLIIGGNRCLKKVENLCACLPAESSVFVYLFAMKTISHLPEEEQQHFEQCPTCCAYFDRRDLNDVLSHEHHLPRVPVLPFTYATKVGSPYIYFKNEHPIIIN